MNVKSQADPVLWYTSKKKQVGRSACHGIRQEQMRRFIKSRFAAKVRTDCYTELHYTSIFGEAASTLEALEFHCSGQSAGTVQHLTDKNAASKQTGPAAVDAFEGDDDDNIGTNDNELAIMAEHAYPSWQGKFDSEDEDGEEENGYTVSSKVSQEAEPAVVVIDGSSGSDSEDAGGSGSALPLLAATGGLSVSLVAGAAAVASALRGAADRYSYRYNVDVSLNGNAGASVL